MIIVKKIFLAVLICLVTTSCGAGEINAARQLVSLDVAIPKLPLGWHVPTREELDHIMRPQSLNLFPDYLAQAYFDNDSILDWVVLSVKNDNSLEGLLVYLSSENDWSILATDNFGKTMKVDMTMSVRSCEGSNSIIYSALGRPGKIYSWDKASKKFVSRKEDVEFE